jgi:hypothetical protein
MSQNTGRAPAYVTAHAVEIHVCETVRTSSPGVTPHAMSAACSEVVPELTHTTSLQPR